MSMNFNELFIHDWRRCFNYVLERLAGKKCYCKKYTIPFYEAVDYVVFLMEEGYSNIVVKNIGTIITIESEVEGSIVRETFESFQSYGTGFERFCSKACFERFVQDIENSIERALKVDGKAYYYKGDMVVVVGDDRYEFTLKELMRALVQNLNQSQSIKGQENVDN